MRATALLVMLMLDVAALASGIARPAVAGAKPREALAFIQDDYARALTLARARKLPLFIEAWAPW